MGIFDKIKSIEKINEAELKNIGQCDSSWHDQYKDSSYIYIGNLDNRLTEGDIIIVFSQYGEPIDINLVRDEETGKSKGYCFLAYADQRSTILAVDNFNGYKLLDRPMVVDHILNYRLPQKYSGNDDKNEYKPTGAEGKGIGVYNVIESEINLSKAFKQIDKQYNEGKRKKFLDEDELWALNFEEHLKNKVDTVKGECIKKKELQNDKTRTENTDNFSDLKNDKNCKHKKEKSLNKYIQKKKKKFDKNNYKKNRYDRKDLYEKYEKSSRSQDKYKSYNKKRESNKYMDKQKKKKKEKSRDRSKDRNKDISEDRNKGKSEDMSNDRNKHTNKRRSKGRTKERRNK